MVLLLAGSSHTGKTLLAQKILETYSYPYFSIDHLKMGLIRSGYTTLTPEDDAALTDYLWPILREMIKTAIENKQNLVIEGCYIPFDWKNSFDDVYRKDIRYLCLIMTKTYILQQFQTICSYANIVEDRQKDERLSAEYLIHDNEKNYTQCQKFHCNYFLIDKNYPSTTMLMDKTQLFY